MQQRSSTAFCLILAASMILVVSAPIGKITSEAAFPPENPPSDSSPNAFYQVTGTVTDSATGWPLYARIDIDGGPDDPVWTDPATGDYSLSLSDGITYTFNIESQTPGYQPGSRPVGPLAGNQVENFALEPDLDTCSAPGYASIAPYWEDFENGDGGYTHEGLEDEWEWGAPVTWPFACASGSQCWGTDLDGDYQNNADYQLVSPLIDLSAIPHGTPLHARWQQAWSLEGFATDHAFAEVSINGGPYQIMWQHTGGTAQVDWTDMSYALSDAAGGNVRFRFRLTSDQSTTYPGYYIDRVRIATDCAVPPGGLVVGNVYDAWTLEGMTGAMVTSDEGESVTTIDTPEDPNLEDGFYSLYGDPGTHPITATNSGYSSQSFIIDVSSGTATELNFYLGADGELLATPAHLQVVLPLSTTVQSDLELINLSGAPIGFEIAAIPEHHAPVPEHESIAALNDVPWLNAIPVSGTIPVGASQPVTVTFDSSVPGIVAPGEFLAELLISNNSTTGDVIVPVTMTVPAFGVEVFPPGASLSGDPGTTLVYSLTLTNTGTISESFAVDLAGNDWTTTFPPIVGPLGPGRGIPVSVSVDIPVDAAGGQTDTAVMRFSSQVYPSATATATLTTSANPTYGIEMTPLFDSAVGAPGEHVTYTLTLTNTGNVVDSYNVGVDSLWPVSAPTTIHSLAAGEKITVSVSVSVPPGALAGSSDTAHITLTSQGDGTRSAGSALETTAAPVYRIAVDPQEVTLTGSPGDVLTYTLRVTNTGNITDTFNVQVISSTWVISVTEKVGPLRAAQAAGLDATISIPIDAAAGETDAAIIRLTSAGDGSMTANASIVTKVAVYGAAMAPEDASQGTAPGGTVTYTLVLTNTGSAADTFYLSVSEVTPGWVVSEAGAGFLLESGDSQVIVLSVTAPARAGYGEVGWCTVSARGTHGGEDTSYLLTQVDRGAVYLPAIPNETAPTAQSGSWSGMGIFPYGEVFPR